MTMGIHWLSATPSETTITMDGKGMKQSAQSLPLYQQVRDMLLEMIEGDEFGRGDKIPSERELSERLGVSRMTVRQGIEEIVRLGLLERRSTKGTYVRETRIRRRIGRTVSLGLSQMLEETGARAGSQLLSFGLERAPREIAEVLSLRLGEPIVVFSRLRLANELPFCIEKSHLSQALVPGLAADSLSGDASLYQLLEGRYGIRATRSHQRLGISYATEHVARLLGVEIGSPVMLLRTVVFAEDGRPVEYMTSINHPDRVVFQTGTA
jgi:GntR family transcriptional regulator